MDGNNFNVSLPNIMETRIRPFTRRGNVALWLEIDFASLTNCACELIQIVDFVPCKSL